MKPTQSCICQWLGNKKSGKVDVKLLPVACSPFSTFTRKLFQQALNKAGFDPGKFALVKPFVSISSRQ